MEFYWYVLGLTVFLIVLLIGALNFPCVHRLLSRNKETVEHARSLVSLLAIASLIIAVISFGERRKIDGENREILLQNLDAEIQYNLWVITLFNEQEQLYRYPTKMDSLPINQFEFQYIGEARNLRTSVGTRELLFSVISHMNTANRAVQLLVAMAPKKPFTNTEEMDGYLRTKRSILDTLKGVNSQIKERLNLIQKIRKESKLGL